MITIHTLDIHYNRIMIIHSHTFPHISTCSVRLEAQQTPHRLGEVAARERAGLLYEPTLGCCIPGARDSAGAGAGGRARGSLCRACVLRRASGLGCRAGLGRGTARGARGRGGAGAARYKGRYGRPREGIV